MLGSSANMTAMAGTVLGLSKGGNTAIAVRPKGTNAVARRMFAGLAVITPPPKGEAPPPMAPGWIDPVD